jgi:hypothetical protein
MFRCQVTGKISKKGEGQIKLTVQSRPKAYFGFLRDEEGKVVFQRDGEGNVLRDENGNPKKTMVQVGQGFEIVKELTVTKEGYDQYMGNLLAL